MRGLGPVLLVASCAGRTESESRALYELERMAFVPEARCRLAEFSPPPFSDCSLTKPIVFDRFEFTRADLEHYWPDHERRAQRLPWSEDAARDAPDRGDWPAFVDFDEARELAQLRGMRLPTPAEWLHVAVGRRNYQVPWGGRGYELWANTVVLVQEGNGRAVDFSLKSPARVGTYENGKSRPFGCYDLLGNVWEWADGLVPGCEPPSAFEPGFDELDDPAGSMTSILGGAYDTRSRPTFFRDSSPVRGAYSLRFHARMVDKHTLSPSIGARMCADAESYLWAMAPRWGAGQATRERVRGVGRRWAEDDALSRASLRDLLSELRTRPGAPPELAWLEEGVLAAP